MSRLTRALGFGGGGDDDNKGSRERAASPRVRRIRETMRWRGYDLSDYTDDQIAAASARFPNDISEDGETTADGRRALAAALEQGDFASAPPSVAADGGRDAGEDVAAVPPAPPPAGRRTESASPTSAHRAALGMPTLPERFAHVFGVHAWRPLESGEGKRLQCVGCGRLRDAPHPFRPPSTPPPPPPPPREGTSSRRESPPSPLDELGGLRDHDQDRDEPGAPPRLPRRKERQRSGSLWDFFLGLPWWTKLLAFFVALQVVLFIVRSIAGGGG